MNKETYSVVAGLERYVYFTITTARNYCNWNFRQMSTTVKLKHYMYMCRHICNKIGSSIHSGYLFNQVLTAMDEEHNYVLRNHYENNMWEYDFESAVELQSDVAHYEQDVEVKSLNLLGMEEHPTVDDVKDEMHKSHSEDYIEFELSDTGAEGMITKPHASILYPEDDKIVIYLNEELEKLRNMENFDMTEEDEVDFVSNDGIKTWIRDFYKEMLRKKYPNEEFHVAEEKYFHYLGTIDVYTMLEAYDEFAQPLLFFQEEESNDEEK